MAKILITGGTGVIGTSLRKRLLDKGYEVAILSRTKKPETSIETYTWDNKAKIIDKKAIDYADYIIHLAGENIGEKRWTKKRRQIIIESRVKSTELILNSVIDQNKKIKAFISASAVGYYGSITSDKIFIENDSSHNDFIGETCREWEQAADKFMTIGVRTVKIRTGIVLTKESGALEKMISPLKYGISALLGNGKQYLPWIHIDDLCDIYIKAIEDIEMNGVYNAVAPEHVSYKDFMTQVAIVIKKPFLNINIPSFILKIIFGKMSSILINGSRVSSNKLEKTGYFFKYPSVKSALKNLLTKEN